MLLHQQPIDPWAAYPETFTPGLLRVNRAIHSEATPLFYGQNRFDFTGNYLKMVPSFLEHIGSKNSGYIQHVYIDFPRFLHLRPGSVTFEKSSLTALTNVQSSCANLKTLKTCLYTTNAMELTLDNLENFEVATEALKLVDTRFRSISSLQDIILEAYKDAPSEDLRERMMSHGWKISIIKYGEEEDWVGSLDGFADDGIDDDNDYGYDDAGDDYDIDNYSDL